MADPEADAHDTPTAGAPSNVMLSLREISVRFGGISALSGVSLEANAGEVLGIIGPNGAGKTTLFDVVSGIRTPNEGRVILDGRDVTSKSAVQRSRSGLRRTFQTEQAIAELSVFDNVLLVHEHTGGDRTTRRDEVSEAIGFTGLADVAHRLVGGLGAAQRRLVEMARAVVGRPRVILFDEPGAGLPDDETALLAELIRRIPDETGALVVLVDHDMSLVSACCTTTAQPNSEL